LRLIDISTRIGKREGKIEKEVAGKEGGSTTGEARSRANTFV